MLAQHRVKHQWDEGWCGPTSGRLSCVKLTQVGGLCWSRASPFLSEVSCLVGLLSPRPGWEIGSAKKKKKDLFRSSL